MLDFDVDADELRRVVEELGAMPKEVNASYNRALTRTAATLRRRSSKGLQSELGLRRAKAIRKRLKSIRVKGSKSGDYRKMASIRLWYGLNDIAVAEFKGRVSETAAGAGYSGPAGNHSFPGAFVAKSRGSKRRTIMRRKGRRRLPVHQETLPIKDQVDVYVEDNIFDQLESIFWHHFRDDLERRVAYLRAK
ncbi:hypothetical protein [Halomonas sp. PAR7]|uniref:hypothetical protein n=1 Tax=Halomonas sp. PAR7 TaxID=3075514 RepID=UPI002885245D|nr:hypothetical protein [Halomonas sp. PAR7]MDT0499706.1 hypothetical protein [Halomonas sp. PAR7]